MINSEQTRVFLYIKCFKILKKRTKRKKGELEKVEWKDINVNIFIYYFSQFSLILYIYLRLVILF